MSDSAMKGGRSSPARRPSISRDCGSSTKLSGSDARRPCGATSPGSSPRHTPATRPTSSKLSAGSRPAAASPSRQQRRSASRKFVSVTTHEHVVSAAWRTEPRHRDGKLLSTTKKTMVLSPPWRSGTRPRTVDGAGGLS